MEVVGGQTDEAVQNLERFAALVKAMGIIQYKK
jgi:hypothetical protein